MADIPRVTVRPTVADDWARYRDLRLEMLTESPSAYRETASQASGFAEGDWRRRTGPDPARSTTLVAVHEGRWVGTAGAHLRRREAELVAVYVVADARGARLGVLDALLEAVERWAADRADSIILHVGEENMRARRAYERRGFHPTGHRRRSWFTRRAADIEMRKRLG